MDFVLMLQIGMSSAVGTIIGLIGWSIYARRSAVKFYVDENKRITRAWWTQDVKVTFLQKTGTGKWKKIEHYDLLSPASLD